ncbi:MAG: hypothetical protein E7222_07140 [Clostridiales bacterium]|jgi:DMSO/TMAO reductase YedYZ heme-binding membrane subunit|nr:hypothetical protein [Clostridiales bacterium]
MIFLIALIEALVFVILCKGVIKKHPGVFYLISIAVIAFIVYYQKAGLYEVLPEWTYTYIISVFWRGAFPTALFVVVMFLGAVEKKSDLARQLMPIRGNLAIIASLMTLAHSFVYGVYYVTTLFSNPQEFNLRDIISLILTVPLFILMILLMVTSFTKVRRRMKATAWKKIQKLAYLWFGLLYLYLMVLLVPSMLSALKPSSEMELFYKVNYVISVLAYTAVFGVYFVMRVRKYIRDKQKSKSCYCSYIKEIA